MAKALAHDPERIGIMWKAAKGKAVEFKKGLKSRGKT